MQTSLLRQPEVTKITGLARPTLYEHMQCGLFPRPIKLGRKFSAWPSYEINAIIAARINGKNNDEIKTLVTELTAARVNYAIDSTV